MPGLRTGCASVILALVLICFSALPGHADRAPAGSPGPEIKAEGVYSAPASFDQGGGKMAVMDWRTTLSYDHFIFSYVRREYSWDDPGRLPWAGQGQNPWDAFNTLRLTARHHGSMTEKWRYLVFAGIESAFEQEVDGSLTALGGGWASYAYSRQLWLNMGAMGYLHKVRALLLPVVGLRWQPDPAQGWSVSVGFPLTKVAYRFNPQWALAWNLVGVDIKAYRLADDSSVQPKGYLESRDLFSGLALEFRPLPNLTLAAGVDYYFLRKFTIHDQDAKHEKEYDLENTLGGRLSLTWRF